MRLILPGTRNGVGSAIIPGGDDIDAGGEDVKDASVIREGSLRPALVNGANGASRWLRSWRCVSRILVFVASSNSHEQTSSSCGGNSVVGSLGETATKTHVADGPPGTTLGRDIVGSPIDTVDDTRVGATAITAEHLDCDQAGPLGNPVRR